MKQYLLILLITILSVGVVSSQTVQQRLGASFEVSEYGVDFQADPRLIVMMAALDVAGFDTGRAPSTFRAKLRKDLANLDPRSYFNHAAHFLCAAQEMSESQILNANPLCEKLRQAVAIV